MRKLFLFMLVILGCNSPEQTTALVDNSFKRKATVPEKIISGYINKNPKWKINEAVEGESCDSMNKEIIASILDKKFFYGLPFKLNGVIAYGTGNKKNYLANFILDNTKFPDTTMAYNMSMQVLGMISEKMKNELVNDSSYYIHGNVDKFETKLMFLDDPITNLESIRLPRVRLKLDSVVNIYSSEPI